MFKKCAVVVWGVVALAALCFGTLHVSARSGADKSAFPVVTRGNFIVLPSDRTMGSPKAPVVLIEYASPTCPHCAEFHLQAFAALKKNYIDAGAVRYVYRVFLLRPDDGPVEKLARCLPANQYFDFVAMLFQKQPEWDADIYPNIDIHDGLIKLAMSAGMAKDTAEKCMRDPALNNRLNQVSDDAVQRYNINGTPSFVVNGVVGQAGELWPHLQQRLIAAIAAK